MIHVHDNLNDSLSHNYLHVHVLLFKGVIQKWTAHIKIWHFLTTSNPKT